VTGEDLLRAVVARPEDDAPRLVYADYLQQHGDPQGELIAVQCRLAGLATDDANRGELELRAKALIAEHGATWAARLGDGITHVDYNRGLAYAARADVRPGMLDVLDRAPIHDLGFSLTDPDEDLQRMHDIAVELARDPRLSRIEMLATGVRWGEPAFAALLASPHLERVRGLYVADPDCEVYAGHALATARLPALEVLALSGDWRGEMGDAGVAALARADFPRLRDLAILNVSCTSAAAHYLARSTTLTELHVLDFGWGSDNPNRLGPAGAEALAGSSNFHALRRLVLDFNAIFDQGLTALANSSHLDELRVLSLKDNHLGDDGLRSFALGTGLPKLESLELTFNRTLTHAGIAALADSPRLATLSSLGLRQMSLGPEAAHAIARSPHARELRSLNLFECKLGDDGARALLESPHLDGLTDLQLGGNAISEDIRTALHERWDTRVRV
jgi:uncharacterized protein (TIGR02996 family)